MNDEAVPSDDTEAAADVDVVEVGEDGAGLRLDVFLSRRFPTWSRSFWARLADEGGLAVERDATSAGRPVASRRLQQGDRVVIDLTRVRPENSTPFTGEVPILLVNDRFVAVDKPPGLLSHPTGRFGTGSLVDLLRDRYGLLHPCGRLDRFTSGVNLFARSVSVCADFERAAERDLIDKQYLALVEGAPPADEGVVDAPIGPADGSWVRLKMAVRPDGKPSRTSWRVVAGRGTARRLLLVTLHSGRKHQIRVHLAHIGCPVVADKLYGATEDLDYFTPGRGTLYSYYPDWQALHCWRLRLPPGLLDGGSAPTAVTAPPSGAFAEALRELRIDPATEW